MKAFYLNHEVIAVEGYESDPSGERFAKVQLSNGKKTTAPLKAILFR